VPKRIMSDQGSVFTGRFWTSFQEALGTQLNFSIAYHSETNGQTKRMNQTLEDMLLWSSLTTTVTRAPLRWRLSSFFTGDRVERL
jgi:transposase InsO family protein